MNTLRTVLKCAKHYRGHQCPLSRHLAMETKPSSTKGSKQDTAKQKAASKEKKDGGSLYSSDNERSGEDLVKFYEAVKKVMRSLASRTSCM